MLFSSFTARFFNVVEAVHTHTTQNAFVIVIRRNTPHRGTGTL